MNVSNSNILIAFVTTFFISIVVFPFLGVTSVVMMPLIIAVLFGYLLTKDQSDNIHSDLPDHIHSAKPKNVGSGQPIYSAQTRRSFKQTLPKRKKQHLRDLSTADNKKVIFFGSLCAFCVSFLLMIQLKPEGYMNYLIDLPQYTMGSVHNFVVDHYYYQLILKNSAYQVPELVFILITTIFTALVLIILFNYQKLVLKSGANVILMMSLVIFFFAVYTGNAPIREKITHVPPDFGYAYDGTAYLKTFYLMEDSNFYNAYVEAFSKHELAKSGEYKIVDGKISGGFVKSPFIWREPFLFYFWNAITPGKGIGIYYLSVFLSAAFLILVHFCSIKIAGSKGSLATIFITPYLITTNLSFNFILPDHTGSMLLTSGILLWLLKKYKASAALFLLALLCREVLLPAVFLIGVLTFFTNKRSGLVYIGCVFSFILIYSFHYLNAYELIESTARASEALVPRPTLNRLLSVSSFHLFPYFVTVIPSAIYFLLGASYWYLRRRMDLVALFAFIVIYDLVASSPYWGQHFMYLLLISAAFLPAMLLSTNKNCSPSKSAARF